MNQGAADDQAMPVHKPVPGPDVRQGDAGVHPGEKADDVHSLRSTGTDAQRAGEKGGEKEGLIDNFIFVFGSNDAGIHGAGAANAAFRLRQFPWGLGEGLGKGCYALPTKDIHIRSHSLMTVKRNIGNFLIFADEMHEVECAWSAHSDLNQWGHTKFQVTRIGCGLAGFFDKDIAPMFAHATPNCWFDEKWRPFLGPNHNYWGTF